MANRFTDRVATQPNRYKLTDAEGNVSYVVLERADTPTAVGTPLNASNLNMLVDRDGDTMHGELTFDNTDDYHALRKLREIDGVNYLVNMGCGIVGGRGVIAFELRDGSTDDAPRKARMEIGPLGIAYMGETGIREYVTNNGVKYATVE